VGMRAVSALAMASLVVACAAASDDETSMGESAATTSPRTAETETVLRNLRSFDFGSVDPFDHRVIVGQQDADISNRASYGTKILGDVERLTGHAPALVSYELSNVDRGATSMFDVNAFRAGRAAMHDLIVEQHRRGVLVSLVWHMRCPKSDATANDSYAPDLCPRDYRLDSLRAGGAHFDEWRAILDELAELLWSLKDDRGQLIPVLIRPFHEYTGHWFWWGRQNSAGSYAAAWREMVTYLRDGRGLHNALWVFCPNTPSESWGWDSYYPGDDFVDVVAFDRYDHDDGYFAVGYDDDLRTIGGFAEQHHKVAAVAEVGIDLEGGARTVDPKWFTRSMLAPLESYRFAYVGLWRNAPWEKFVPEPGDGALAADFVEMAHSPTALMSGQHDLYSPLHASVE
jgi:mannan endo-1,4-beta-mannosidase